MSSELEDYESLISQSGWLRLVNAITAEWHGKIEAHTLAAVNVTDDKLALDRLRQVLAAKQAALGVLAWPAERIRILGGRVEALMEQPSMSRRGPL